MTDEGKTSEPERSEVGGGERERIAAWLARGNPPGGMNLPSHDGTTPSIRSDLRALLAENARKDGSGEGERGPMLEPELSQLLAAANRIREALAAAKARTIHIGHYAIPADDFRALTELVSRLVVMAENHEAENQRLAERVGWRSIESAPAMETVLVAGGDAHYPVTRIAALEEGLDLALAMLAPYEPPDSRAVSNEYVALMCVAAGRYNAEDITVIRRARAMLDEKGPPHDH